MLCFNLEAANSHPNKALDFLEALFYDAERISQFSEHALDTYEEQFVRGFNEAHA